MSQYPLWVCDDDALGAYHFGSNHPFGPQRLPAYQKALATSGLEGRFERFAAEGADDATLERFHTAGYISQVHAMAGSGAPLDRGDTLAVADIDRAAARVVGTVVRATEAIMAGECRRAFIPIAGLHHARRDRASGFCVFNDCGMVIETLRQRHGLRRIAYVDIDVHHGDGVFYSFEDDPDLLFAD
ncbi:MAG: acetoin utilization protein AcuC, partial [Thiohalospira sp.]